MRTQRTSRFSAVNKGGRTYTIYEYTYIVDLADRGTPGEEKEGMKFYKTSKGDPVNVLAKGKYEIVSVPNIPLTSDDPNAP